MDKQYYVYIMTNKKNSVVYTGVTNDIKRRAYEHRERMIDSFTKRYKVVKLAYYESYNDINDAIRREKQIKGGSRAKKFNLINSMNKDWKDLYFEI